MPDSRAAGVDVVLAAARAFERDRYLAALLAPRELQADLHAVAAFAGELARIPAYVSEPMIGEIRLQWWHDVIDGSITSAPPASGSPIADALLGAMQRHRLSTDLLHAIIEAQAARLDDAPFEDLQALLDNLAAWDGGLFELAWRVLGGRGERPPMLTHAAETYGLARCLAEIPAELALGRMLLPRTMLAAHGIMMTAAQPGVSDAGIAAPTSSDVVKWRALIADAGASVERQFHVIAEEYQNATPSERLAALPVALVRPYLHVSRQADVSTLAVEDVWPLTRVWRLWRTSRTGRL